MEEINGFSIKFSGNTTSFDNSVKGVNKALRLLRQEGSTIGKSIKLDPTNLDNYKRKVENLEQRVVAVTKKHDLYAKALEELGQRTDTNATLFDELTSNISNCDAELQILQQQIAKVNTQMDKLPTKRWDDLSKTLESSGKKITDVGNKLMPMSIASGTALVGATKSAIDFDQAFIGVQKTVTATSEQLAILKDGIIDMSNEIPFTTSEIAQIVQNAGQLGIETDNLLEFSEVMLGIGTATNLTAEEASMMIAQFSNITGLEGDYENLASSLIHLGNTTATTERDIMELAQRLSGVAVTVGMSEQDILALSATMASVGITAEAGGTSMSTWFAKIEQAVAKGGNSVKKFAEVSNMSIEEFSTKWETRPIEAIHSLLKGLNDMEKNGEDSILVLGELGVSAARVRDNVLRLANAEEKLSKNVKASNEAWDENVAFQKEVDLFYGSVSNTLKTTFNNLRNLGMTIGEVVLPYIDKFNEKFKDFIKQLNEADPKIKKIIALALVIGTTISPLLSFIGGLSTSIGTLMGYLTPMISSISSMLVPILSKITTLLAPLGRLLSTIFTPIISKITTLLAPLGKMLSMLLSPLSAIGLVLGTLYLTNEKVRNSINLFVTQLIQALMPILNTLVQIFNESILPVWNSLCTVIGNLINTFIAPLINWIGQLLMPIIISLAGLISNSLNVAFKILSEIISFIIDIIDGLINGFNSVWQILENVGVIETIIGLFQYFGGVIKELIDFFNELANVVSSVWNTITGFFNEVGNKIGSWWGDIWSSGGLGVNAQLMASGGLGIRNLTINAPINVNNQGKTIGVNDVNSWIKQIADGVSEELGRRLI